jgi:hypothetical protein
MRAKVAASALVVALIGAAIGNATWSAFSAQASNAGDTFAAGTVILSDNDAGAVMTTLARARPGDTSTGCTKITYSGSLPATLKLYSLSTGTLAPYVTIEVTRGTQSAATFPSCTGFTPDARDYYGLGAGVLYRGALSGVPSTYATGANDPDAATGLPETWTSGESHVYRFVVTLGTNLAGRGLSATTAFTAEAHNL